MCDEEDIYICDDRPIPVPEYIQRMTDEEIEMEFQRIFGEYQQPPT